MKICMIGLGSIGQRHLGNIIKVAEERGFSLHVDALRHTKKALPEKIEAILQNQYDDIEQLPDNYDSIFICNPSVLHYQTLIGVLGKTRHCFVEKPVFTHPVDLSGFKPEKGRIFYVACPIRHKWIVQEIKRTLDSMEDRVIGARAICSSYLPDWRRNTDYRACYSSHREMGGGVVLDLIHEWDYLGYLFGRPDEVVCGQGRYSDLEIDSEDCASYIGKYKDKLVEIHLDYFGHRDERVLQLFLNRQRMDVDLIENRMLCYRKNQLINEIKAPVEDFYLQEMQYFFDCIEGKEENFNTVFEANELLRVIGVNEGYVQK